MELAPRATEPRYQFGRVLLQAGSASSASSAAVALEECLRLDPQMREAWLPLARAYQALGRHAEARQAFAAYRRFSDYRREAAQLELRLRRAPDSPALLVRMAALQEKHERLEAAVHFYRRALRVRPDRRIEAHLAELQRRARAQGESPSLRPGRQTRQE